MCTSPKPVFMFPPDTQSPRGDRSPIYADGLIHEPPGGVLTNLSCGRCPECRKKRSRDWMVRLTGEINGHTESSFLTLTYSEAALPPNRSLRMDDTTSFFKKLRSHLQRSGGPKIKLFCAGEYSPENKKEPDKSFRPHYHAILFGHAALSTRKFYKKSKTGHSLYTDDTLEKLWGHGNLAIGDVTPASAQYTANYTVDKVYGRGADDHYDQRESERMRCSRNLGLAYLWRNYNAIRARKWTCILPDGAEHPIPRYFQKKILELGPPELSFMMATNMDYLDLDRPADFNPSYERKSRLAIHNARKSMYTKEL